MKRHKVICEFKQVKKLKTIEMPHLDLSWKYGSNRWVGIVECHFLIYRHNCEMHQNLNKIFLNCRNKYHVMSFFFVNAGHDIVTKLTYRFYAH